MARDIDSLTSSTLKHLRDRWWDAAFTGFLRDVLQPQPGERVLDVGCGAGTAELILRLLQNETAEGQDGAGSPTHFIGVDLLPARLRDARRAAREHGLSAEVAAGDAASLPFKTASFDGAFAVSVLQHVGRPDRAVRELARVIRPGGRVVVVEPDNAARYWFSHPSVGREAFDLATRFFSALDGARGEHGDSTLGPRLPGLLGDAGFEPLSVHLFPVSTTRLAAPVSGVWHERLRIIKDAVERASDESLARLGRDLFAAVERYAEEAAAAGPAFVEIQNTLLFATTAQRRP